MQNAFVYRVAHDTNEARLTVLGVPDSSGIGAHIFRALAGATINVDSIIYNHVLNGAPNVSFMIHKKDVPKAMALAKTLVKEIGANGFQIEEDVARISIIGSGLHNPSGIVAELFEVFGDEKINIQMISTSEHRVACLIKIDEVNRAVKALIKKFGLDAYRELKYDESKEEIDFAIPFDAPFDYSLINP